MAVDDRQTADLVLGHRLEGLADRVVGPDRDRLALAELAGIGRLRVLALGQHADHDVAIGEHPLQAIVLPADRQRADAELLHLARRFRDRLVLADALGSAAHHVPG